MSENKFVEYLVLGGLRHGEVWVGPLKSDSIDLPVNEDKRLLPKFYSRDTEAEITTPLNDTYFISEYVFRSGEKYMIASTDPLSAFDVEKEINRVSPPLKALE